MSHFYFCLPRLKISGVLHTSDLYMYPSPFFFLLKYYCVVIQFQYYTNCNNSYLCDLQQKNDVSNSLSICSMVQLYIGVQYSVSTSTVGNENIAQTKIATDSKKLKKVKAVIIICQISNQIVTTEENYCISKLFF